VLARPSKAPGPAASGRWSTTISSPSGLLGASWGRRNRPYSSCVPLKQALAPLYARSLRRNRGPALLNDRAAMGPGFLTGHSFSVHGNGRSSSRGLARLPTGLKAGRDETPFGGGPTLPGAAAVSSGEASATPAAPTRWRENPPGASAARRFPSFSPWQAPRPQSAARGGSVGAIHRRRYLAEVKPSPSLRRIGPTKVICRGSDAAATLPESLCHCGRPGRTAIDAPGRPATSDRGGLDPLGKQGIRSYRDGCWGY
jgi:hypothetical protein